jgi:teichuronic acid biosynthesis glycosyltransferase TuaH
VDWRWIRQRPHWFAEEAQKRHEVLVAYRLHGGRRRLPTNPSDVRRFAMLPLPLGRLVGRPKLARPMLFAQRAWLGMRTMRFRPTHVYVSHPKLVATLPRRVRRTATLVYDCMDDAVAMAPARQQAAMLRQEEEITSAAQVVITSSRVLSDRLADRFGADVRLKTVLVQNGLHIPRIADTLSNDADRSSMRTEAIVGYAGTVARWFDFESVTAALDACPRVRLRVVGPRTGLEPVHERIDYLPPVNHSELPRILSACDALIMPFKHDPIVTAVNPVKLYEYLAYGLPIIAFRYGEIEADFRDFVEFYSTADELIGILRALEAGHLKPKGGTAERRAFMGASTWPERWEQVWRAKEAVTS